MSIPGGAPSLFFAAAAGAAADFAIDRSLRFNSADSSSLSRTPSSASNRRTWTWSGWVKKGASSAADAKPLFAVNGGSNATSFTFRFDNGTDDTLRVENNFDVGSPGARTVAVFRDFSSWMHVVLAMDTTQSNVTDGLKIYVNGVLQQLQNTVWNSNIETLVNSTNAHYLGTENTSNRYFDGYLADVQFVDGQALAPTDFGETDSNGVWQGKLYSGSYGTNGFHLKFADNSTDSALGTDSSGNSNTWTVNNLQASTGDTTPSENFTAVTYTGNGGTQSISSLSFSPDLLWIKSRNSTYDHYLQDSVRGATKTLEANQTGAETTNADGVSSFDANGFSVGAGTGYTAANVNNINYVAWAFNAGANSNKTYTVKVVSDGGNKYRFDDFGTSAVTLELAEGSTYVFDQSDSSNSGHPLRFSTTSNGTHGGGSEYTTGVTVTGTPGSAGAKTTIVVAASAPTLYYYCTQHSGMGGQANTNTTAGASNFDGGIQSVVKANQAKGIAIGKFTGTGSINTVGTGLSNTKMVILKNRDSSSNWVVYHNIVDGSYDYMYLNLTNANASSGTPHSMNNTFKVGSNTDTNASGDKYSFFAFSPVAGFSSLGQFSGSGSSGNAITTGFPVAFVMIKRKGSAGSWAMYDIRRGDNIWLEANKSDADGNYHTMNLSMTSTGFTLNGTDGNINASGGTYIYMAFADNLGGEGCDSLVDTPEQRADQSDNGAGGNVVGNYATLNPVAADSGYTLSNGNLDASGNVVQGHAPTTIYASSGKFYCEFTLTTFQGDTGVGVAASIANPDEDWIGEQAYTVGYLADGRIFQSGSSTSYSSYAAGDVIGVAFDVDTGKVWFSKNGTYLNSGNPAAGSGEVKTISGGYGLGFTFRSVGSGAGSFNFGARNFAYSAPSGFKCLNTGSLPTPTIADGSQYFDATLWTGNGGTQIIGGPVYSNSITGSFNSGAGQGADKAFNGTTSGTNYAAASNGSTAVFTNMGITGITKIRLSLAKNNTGDNWGNLILNDGTTNTNLQSWLQSNYSGRGNSASFIDVTSQFSASTLESISIDASGSVDVRIAGVEINDNVLLDGNGSTISFSPDLALIKARTGNAYSVFFDTVRGVNKRLSITNAAEADEGANGVSAFGTNSLTVTDNSAGDYNVNGPAGGTYSGSSGGYVGWIWEGGDLVTNNAYNQAQVWSTSFTSSNGFDTDKGADKAFDGLTTTYSQPTGALNTSPGVLNATIENITSMRIMFKGRLHLNSGSELASEVNEGVWYTVSSPPSTLTKLEVYPYTHQAVGPKLFAVEINGKQLVDAGLIPASGLNSSAYDQSQTWSSSLTSSNGFWSGQPATNAFNGTGSSVTGTNNGGTLTFSPNLTIPANSTIEVRTSTQSGGYTVVVNGVSNSITGDSFQTVNYNGATTLSSITITSAGSASGDLKGIKVNGALLTDPGVSLTSVPSVASTVRVSQTAGCSIVSYNATGSNLTVGHGLNTKPALILLKSRNVSGDWLVMHESIGVDHFLKLNETQAKAGPYSNVFTSVSNLTFGTGNDSGINSSGQQKLALCFAPVAGYSAMGTYEGTGSDVFVYLGFRPRFILHKDADTAHNWHIFDTARDPDNPVVARLFPNNSNAENTSNNNLDILSNGFVAKDSNTTTENGKTYIYMAFAENPFSLARAR